MAPMAISWKEVVAQGKRGSPGAGYKQLFGAYIFPSRSKVFPSWIQLAKRQPVFFFLWFHARRLWFLLTGFQTQQLVLDPSKEPHTAGNVLPYNMTQILGINNERTERLMNVFKSIQGLDLSQLKVLCVGPRNEAEILLLSLYGFDTKNITSIDLFTYSPTIKLMDMHDLKFTDREFDVVYLSYVLTYSDKIARACQEVARVTKDGGFVAAAFEHYAFGETNLFGLNNISGGLKELFGYFEGRVQYVYWQEEFQRGKSFTCSCVFQISKRPGSSNGAH
jgi:hypothetical protein